MTYKTAFLGIAVVLIVFGCSNNSQSDKSNSDTVPSQQEQAAVDSNVIKVYVDKDGRITADGSEVSLNDLDSSFSKLKAGGGTVYYSRANSEGEPPPQSMKVIELIVKHSLHVKLFTDNTFTVIVKPG